jgi:hypothetical protein
MWGNFNEEKEKVTVWDALRRYLYRYKREVEKGVKIVKVLNTETAEHYNEYWLDCGCAPEKHTCSNYFFCRMHSGWDCTQSPYNLDIECWKCREGGFPPVEWWAEWVERKAGRQWEQEKEKQEEGEASEEGGSDDGSEADKSDKDEPDADRFDEEPGEDGSGAEP